jgi:hypothetical protein
VRAWVPHGAEVRGQAVHVRSGRVRYFREWAVLEEFIAEVLADSGVATVG